MADEYKMKPPSEEELQKIRDAKRIQEQERESRKIQMEK